MDRASKNLGWGATLLITLVMVDLPPVAAQGQQDDPPGRVARLGYMQGSVSFQPAGEPEWVQAVPNRPMTTGDKLWADNGARAELQLGSAVIRLDRNTGFSFLNLDDRTAQIQLTSGSLNISVRRLDRDDVFEIDTANQAFSIMQPGKYRVEASEDGNYTIVSVRQGEGESTGNGQNFTLHAGQKGTFSGTSVLTADVVQIGGPDEFDNWAYARENRHENSRSAQYVSHDVVGYDDLDDYGDWRNDSNYGHVWFPNRVAAGWAPYRDGHWDWISPWGWTWVDDASWGYAPFHYGRWVTVGGRWGWVAGPAAVRAVYAPALVVFVGAGGVGLGGNVGWFPLGPREVYVPSYHVSRDYVNRVNISNTTVNNTSITNVYNTTIVNKSTNITNVTYVNREVKGAVTAVPQRAFVSSQPVARAAAVVSARDIASAPVSSRVAVVPTRESVLGAKAATANRIAVPPAAVANRQVIAKATPPPPPVAFAKQQQALAAHPGQPLARHEVQNLRPANVSAMQPMVRQAPPGKPATPNIGRPGNQPVAARASQPSITPPANQPTAAKPDRPSIAPPASQPTAARPGQPPIAAPASQPPAARPGRPSVTPPANQPTSARPGQPSITPPASQPPAARPGRPSITPPPNPGATNRAEPTSPPSAPANNPVPTAPNNRPEPNRTQANRAETGRPAQAPMKSDRPSVTPNNRPEPIHHTGQPEGKSRPVPAQMNQATPNNRPKTNQNPASRSQTPPPTEHTRTPSVEAKAAPTPPRQRQKPQTPEEKKREQEQQKPPAK